MRHAGAAILGGVALAAGMTVGLATPAWAAKAQPHPKKACLQLQAGTKTKWNLQGVPKTLKAKLLTETRGVKPLGRDIARWEQQLNSTNLTALTAAATTVALDCATYGVTGVLTAATPPASAPPSSAPEPFIPPTTTTTAPSGPVQLAQGAPAMITQNGSSAGSVVVQSVNITTQPANSFGEAPANGYFVIANIAASSSINGFDVNPVDFYAVDSNGTHYTMGDGHAFEALAGDELSVSTLNAGENASGPLAFDTATPHGYIVYAPNLNGAPLAEWAY